VIVGINVDPAWEGGRPDPARLQRLGAGWVRFVSRDSPDLFAYRDVCHDIGLRVLAVIARESGGYMLPDCDMYQIGNEPDLSSPSSWTRTPSEYIEDWRIYRDTYPNLPMISAGFASGIVSYYQQVAPYLHNCAAVAVHPYAKNPTEAHALLQQYRAVRSDLALWATEWNRDTDQVVAFGRMLKVSADAAFWFCATNDMVAGMGLLGTPREQMWAASA
jgi:hypothetical protein